MPVPPKRWEAETCSWVSATLVLVLPLRGRRREATVEEEAGAKDEADERQQQRARAARLLEDI